MAFSDELERQLQAITEFMDYVPPAEWRALVKEAFANEDTEGVLWPNQTIPENPQLQASLQDYREWKRMLARVAIPAESAFRRDFWRRLVRSSEKVGEIFRGVDHFGKNHALLLMGEVLSLAMQRELSEAERLNDAGFELHAAGGYEDALWLHNQAIAVAPDFALAWVNKGIALKNLGRLDEAIRCYDRVIEQLDPQYKKAWHNKGVALMTKGTLQDAVECFDRALKIDPRYEVAGRAREKCLNELQADTLIAKIYSCLKTRKHSR